jgi:hypothetical protein
MHVVNYHYEITKYIKNGYQSTNIKKKKFERRVCRYQRGNQNLYIEEEQTTQ